MHGLQPCCLRGCRCLHLCGQLILDQQPCLGSPSKVGCKTIACSAGPAPNQVASIPSNY